MEGAVNAMRSCSGLGVMEGSEAELAIGANEEGSEGTSEIEAKGLGEGGPVAGEDNVMGGAELVVREVRAPRGICSRE